MHVVWWRRWMLCTSEVGWAILSLDSRMDETDT